MSSLSNNSLVCITGAVAVGFVVGTLWKSYFQRIVYALKKNPNHQLRKEEDAIYVGIDLGGTTIGVAVVNSVGNKLASAAAAISDGNQYNTNNNGNPRSVDSVVGLMCALVHEALNLARVENNSVHMSIDNVVAFGIGAPGLLNISKGTIQAIANFEWTDVHITNIVAKRLQVDTARVYLENDANAALLAELWTGAGKEKKNVLMLTLGTGVGCAIMSSGHLLRGCSGDAGEVGHTIIVPNGRVHGTTGVRGIFEAYASATAVVARVDEELQSCPIPSPLRQLQAAGTLTCAAIFQYSGLFKEQLSEEFREQLNTGVATDAKCSIAKKIVGQTIQYIGIGCINVCRCYDPEIVIITGGMTGAGNSFLNAIRDAYCEHHWNITAPNRNRIVLASCGTDAGAVGAAAAGFLGTHGTFDFL
jgi:glucokinase